MGLLNNYLNKKISNYINQEVYDIDPSAAIVRDEQYSLLENRVWYSAENASELEKFYKTTIKSSGLFNDQTFYRRVSGKVPRVHIPVAKLLTNTIVNLVFSETPELTVDTGNQKLSEELNKEILDTLDENRKEDLFKELASMVSYSGLGAIKPVIDREVSDYVILQVYPKENIEVIKKYGRITDIIFKDYYDDYVLKSDYGIGYIKFSLWKGDKQRPLTDREETADLHDWYFYNKDGSPMKILTAIYVENNPNMSSDYAGCLDMFQALDEIKSTILYIERAVKPKRGVPSNLCEIDRSTGKAILPNSWDVEEVLLEVEDPEQKIKNMSDVVFNNPDVSSYETAYDNILKDICAVVGLSPNTLGDTADAGANASGESINVRERASLRKRASLITRYDRAFRELIKLILTYNKAEIYNDKLYVDDFSEYEYFVDFSEYASVSFESMINTMKTALEAGLVSQEYALKELYEDDIGEEGIAEMLAQIKQDETSLLEKMRNSRTDSNEDTNNSEETDKEEDK